MVLPEQEYDPKLALRAAKRRRPDPAESAGFAIRDATIADMPDCREIYNHYVRNSVVTFDETPLTQAGMRAKFQKSARHGHPFLVAVSPSGEVLGYALVSPYHSKSAYRFTAEDSIYLAPAATGKGIGTVLLGELIERSRSAGLRELVAVIADQGADASIALHERFGFVEHGRMGRVGFKFDHWVGTITLQKSLK